MGSVGVCGCNIAVISYIDCASCVRRTMPRNISNSLFPMDVTLVCETEKGTEKLWNESSEEWIKMKRKKWESRSLAQESHKENTCTQKWGDVVEIGRKGCHIQERLMLNSHWLRWASRQYARNDLLPSLPSKTSSMSSSSCSVHTSRPSNASDASNA